MSLWDDLLKQARGVVAQINPLDGGQTYDSVVNNKPVNAPKPVVTKPRNPAVEIAAPKTNNTSLKMGSISTKTPSILSVKSAAPTPSLTVKPTPKPAPVAPAKPQAPNPIKIVTDAARPISEGGINPFAEAGKFVEKNIIPSVVDTAVKAGNTVALPVATTAAAVTGANKNPETQKQLYGILKNSFISPEVAGGKANPLEFGKEFTNAGVRTSELLPIGKGVAAASGATKLSLSQLGKIAASNAKQATVFGTASTANDVIQGNGVTPESLAANYLAPAVLGGGSEIIGTALKPAIKAARHLDTYGIEPPTKLTPDELTAARRVREAQQGYRSTQDLTDQDMQLYHNAETKLGQKPGTVDGHMAVMDALDSHRDFDVRVEKRRQEVMDSLEAANQFTREHLIPGGTLDAPLNPRVSKELQDAIDARIYETNPELFHTVDTGRAFSEGGGAEIPRLHVNDVQRYFGHTEDIPSRYKRTAGKEDIDELAAHAGFDDVDEFVGAIQQELATRSAGRTNVAKLAEMRRDPRVVEEARASLKTTEKAALEAEAKKRGLVPDENGNQEALKVLAAEKRGPMLGMAAKERSIKLKTEAIKRGLIDEGDVKDATPIREVLENRLPRTGEQYAKPKADAVMDKGRPALPSDREVVGQALVDSARGGSPRRVEIDPSTGMGREMTQQPDGSWKPSQEPAITSAEDWRGLDAVEFSNEVTAAARKAIEDGKEIHFYSVKNTGDERALSAEVKPFDPERMYIDGGFVKDARTNEILGNHIKVDDTGISINIGKNIINMDSVLGDPVKWKNMNKSTYTMDRLLEAAAPDQATYRKARSFIIEHKQKAEANMRTDLKQYRDQINDWRDKLMSQRPKGMRKDQYMQDIFFYAERKLAQTEAKGKMLDQEGILRERYPEKTVKEIMAFDKWARKEYNGLLDRTNEVLREFGHAEVPKRDNYMTHLQEDSLWDKIGLGEDLYRDLSSGISGEANPHNRGTLPGTIAGKTETFRPTKKYNPFHETRRGTASMTDPFKAMDAYGEAALFNIHMTESAVRARSVESVFRTAEEIVQRDMIQQVNKDLQNALKQSLGGQRGDLVVAFQEYANALAGKSNSLDRAFQDRYGASGRVALRLSRALQRVASNASIVGNASVTIAQTLNLPNNIGTNGIRNTLRGVSRMISDISPNGEPRPGSPASKSDFLKVRYTDAQSKINATALSKANKKVSSVLLMPQVERAMTEMVWQSSYEKALRGGYKGLQAVKEADRVAERIVGGRGLADQPDIYRSTVGRTFLQYTLEVNAALKNVRKDMPIGGVIKYAAAVFAMNWIVKELTGRSPLPDFIGATTDTIGDFMNSDDDKKDTIGDNLLQGGQRFISTAANMSPVASAILNLLPQSSRKAAFGEDSNLGRYDGSPAAAQVVGKLMEGAFDLFGGNFGGALDNSLAAVPYGSQIRKTTQGLGSMMNGYATDGSGKATTTVDASNPLAWVQAALFGKNSIPEVRSYYENKGSSLGDKQQETFDKLKDAAGIQSAKDYLNAVMTRRAASKSDDSETDDFMADAKVKLAEGTWIEKNGLVVNKDTGKPVQAYYKKLAKLAAEQNDQSDNAYQAYLQGYGITTLGSGNAKKTGDSTLDQLNSLSQVSDEKDVINQALGLIKKSNEGYDEIPGWVTDRYLKDNNIDRDDALYAAKSSYPNASKLEVVNDDIKDKSHDQVLDYLAAGRVQSIVGDYWASQGVLASLRDAGVISKSEYNWLNKLKVGKDGNVIASGSGSGSGGRGKKLSAEELKAGNATVDLERAIAEIIKKAGARQAPKKISYKKRT